GVGVASGETFGRVEGESERTQTGFRERPANRELAGNAITCEVNGNRTASRPVKTAGAKRHDLIFNRHRTGCTQLDGTREISEHAHRAFIELHRSSEGVVP